MPVGVGQTRPFSFYLTPSYSPEPVILEAGGTSTTLFLPSVSYQSILLCGGVTQTPASLGTTEYYTNGETYTYSEAEFPSLSDLATSTVTTTTLPTQTSQTTSATSITVVPVWVQAGVFYWSPVPQPTPKPGDIPVPPLPSFPPIPTAPCFKLFDLFSIECPPNRFIPTTTFISDAPSPICTDADSHQLLGHLLWHHYLERQPQSEHNINGPGDCKDSALFPLIPSLQIMQLSS